MSQHAPLWPILIPFATALLQLTATLAWQRRLAAVATVLGLLSAICLVHLSDTGPLLVYALGNWTPPFGIVLVADRLAAGMVMITMLLGGICLLYACQGWDAHGRHFHPIYQLQLVGLNGAFLTADLFNLFVFFEIMLLASYLLLAQGGGQSRTRSGLIYVVINLLGSSLFLIALGTLYGALGTLNLADVAWRAAQANDNEALIRVAVGLLVAVFVLKAALLPLSFWLPQTYAVAPAPVAALFSIMTKVGIVALLRVQVQIIEPNFSELTALWLTPLALATLVFGVVGVMAASNLRSLSAWLVLVSAGTLQCVPGLASPEGTSAGLFYLTHSTFAGAGLFLLAEMVAEKRGGAQCCFDSLSSTSSRPPYLFGLAYLLLAVAVAGLPPLSGFIGKIFLLRSSFATAWPTGTLIFFWTVLLLGSFAVAITLGRAGSRLFWQGAKPDPAPHQRTSIRLLALYLLVIASPVLVVLAQPIHAYASRAAMQLHDTKAYIQGVLGPHPERIERTEHYPPGHRRKELP